MVRLEIGAASRATTPRTVAFVLLLAVASPSSCAVGDPRPAGAGIRPLGEGGDAARDSAGEFVPDTGFFVGVAAIRTAPGGDFAESRMFTQSDFFSTTTTVIPEADTGNGGRLALGWRWSRAAVEASWQETKHRGSDAAGNSYDVQGSSLDVIGRLYLPSPTPRVKPSLLAGLALPELEIDSASTTRVPFSGAETHDVTLSGAGVDLGLGIDLYVTRHASIDLLALYRWSWLEEDLGSQESIVPRTMRGRELILGVGASWTF